MSQANHWAFYIWLYARIKSKAGKSRFIPYPIMLEVLKRSIPWTPHWLYYPIIKDLEKLKYIRKTNTKRLDRRSYEIIGGNVDLILNQFKSPI